MGTRILVVDDIDGTIIEDPNHKPVTFSFGDTDYKIDLNSTNVRKLTNDFAKWIKDAEVIDSNDTTTKRAGSSKKTGQQMPRERRIKIIEWAKKQGLSAPDRGRIAQATIDAYDAAH